MSNWLETMLGILGAIRNDRQDRVVIKLKAGKSAKVAKPAGTKPKPATKATQSKNLGLLKSKKVGHSKLSEDQKWIIERAKKARFISSSPRDGEIE